MLINLVFEHYQIIHFFICFWTKIFRSKKSLNSVNESSNFDMTSAPVLDLYYVCCGKWNEGNDLRARVTLDIQPLIDTQNFTSKIFRSKKSLNSVNESSNFIPVKMLAGFGLNEYKI